jgi:hypothetical protein
MKTKEYLLEKWIVVGFDDVSREDSIKVTRRDNFENQDLCACYSKHGQTVGCVNAGCYAFSNSECSIFLDFQKAAYEICPNIEVIVDENEMTDHEFCELFIDPDYNDGAELFGNDIFEILLTFFKKWKFENENHTQALAWTFHDSHNFATIVIESDLDLSDCVELDEDEQVEILSQMPESAPFIPGVDATEESEDYYFHFDRWATNPWFCNVLKKSWT